jgi:hypothetical protein
MMLFENAMREAEHIDKKMRDPDTLICPKCGSDHFTAEKFTRYRVDQASALCQEPAAHPQAPGFWFLRCVCGEVIEPPLSYIPGDKLTKIYLKLVELLKKVLP